MNEIFILRHGKAEEAIETKSKNDFDRKLTIEGQKRTKKLGLFFNSLEESIDLVLASSYLRAKETAEIFVDNQNVKPKLEIVEFLSAGSSIREIAKGLLDYQHINKVLLVGHVPDLELFLGKLIGAESVGLKKGALAKVVLNNNINFSGRLEWLITSLIVKNIKLKDKEVTTTD